MHWGGWVAVAIVCAVLEIVTPSFFIGWFGVGAIAGALMSVLRVGPVGQALVFLAVSIGLVLSTRRFASKWTRQDALTKTNIDAIVGKTGVVTKEIPANDRGQVKVGGEVWSAESVDGRAIPQGVSVEVLRVDGVRLVVKAPE
ncbi:MAG TPA: NfeD family protein [Firmicutes bacterium]|nr:NfeD family protein [Candidatus Fermentithermobacillaceae bacterium]